MSDYPDHFPPFMRDFHQQKDLFKAFFVWRGMMDKRSSPQADLARRSNFADFMCLFASMVDFLHQHGWQIQRTRKRGEYADIDKSVRDLLDLQSSWFFLIDFGGLHLKNPEKHIDAPMEQWAAWLEFMPEDVQRAWDKRLAEKTEVSHV